MLYYTLCRHACDRECARKRDAVGVPGSRKGDIYIYIYMYTYIYIYIYIHIYTHYVYYIAYYITYSIYYILSLWGQAAGLRI